MLLEIALTPSTGMDLRLDNNHGVTCGLDELPYRIDGLVNGRSHDTLGNGDTPALHERLRLILVDLHVSS